MTDSFSRSKSDGGVKSLSGGDGDHQISEIENFLEHVDHIDLSVRWDTRFDAAAITANDHEGNFIAPMVFELGRIRGLLANWSFIHSAMSIDDPYKLMLEYTQAMMGFLLFNSQPETIEIIGLGGGSLAKYCHRYLPQSKIRGVEVDGSILEIADQFFIPPVSDRFEIIWGDGADFVVNDENKTDVLLVDGFDSGGQPPQLCSLEFYRACHARLNPGGVFVANLCTQPFKQEPCSGRIRDIFGQAITISVELGMNLVVLACKDKHQHFDKEQLINVAITLKPDHPLPLIAIAASLYL